MVLKQRNCIDRYRAHVMRRSGNPASVHTIRILTILSQLISSLRPTVASHVPTPAAGTRITSRACDSTTQQRLAGRYSKIPSWEVIVKDLQRPGTFTAAAQMLVHWVPAEARPWVDNRIRDGDWYELRMLSQPKVTHAEFQDRILSRAFESAGLDQETSSTDTALDLKPSGATARHPPPL